MFGPFVVGMRVYIYKVPIYMMPKIYKLLKLLDFNTFLFEKKKTSGERVKENVAYPKWNNHFLHNIFYGVVLGGIIINSPAFLLELFFDYW